MAAPTNLIDSAAVNASLSVEFVENFTQDTDRLLEILDFGADDVEVMPANAQIFQLKVTGELVDTKTDDSSSGTEYVEGDLVALSKYQTKKIPLDAVDIEPYRKLTSAKAILTSGYEKAVMRTDKQMSKQMRAKAIRRYLGSLANGTGTASGTGLQAALAYSDEALASKMEDYDDELESPIHFISRRDAAAYLATAQITTQNLFGMTYLENFLGVTSVFVTNKIPSGTMYTTCKENIRVYGLDFGELSRAGLPYVTDASGLIGVYHASVRDHISVETGTILGMSVLPEVTDYIIKGTIAPTA